MSSYNSPLVKPSLLQWTNGLIGGVASLEGDNLVVFYQLCASEIWPDNYLRGVAFGESDLVKMVFILAKYRKFNPVEKKLPAKEFNAPMFLENNQFTYIMLVLLCLA